MLNKELFSFPNMAANVGGDNRKCEGSTTFILSNTSRRHVAHASSAAQLRELHACFPTIHEIGRNEACYHATS